MIEPQPLADFEREVSDSDAPLGDVLLRLSVAMTGRRDALDVGRSHLDDLASGVATASPDGILERLASEGFQGDTADYHAEENSYLDRVLERRVGMPITLSAVVVEVGRRLDVDLWMIGFPGHVLVGIGRDPDSFLDPFEGRRLTRAFVEDRFRAMFPGAAHIDELPDALFGPTPNEEVALRVCRNLTATFDARDSSRLGDVVELEAVVPQPDEQLRDLVARCEGLARWDVAARVRARLDPDDPEIATLWSRLN